MAVGWAFVSWPALRPEPLSRSECAAVRTREGGRYSYLAIAFYATCVIVAAWRDGPAKKSDSKGPCRG